jgi:hypothetical protein
MDVGNQWLYLVYHITPWLGPVCAIILAVAALLHWQRARHWCLLTMGAGALVAALGAITCRIVQMQLLRPMATLTSEAVKFNTSLVTIWMWVVALGAVVAAVGGIGAIHWAIALRRCK